MTAQYHKISKQQWRVSAETADQAFALRQQLSEQWKETFLPIFDKAFTEFTSADEFVYIPKIEIKLKVTNDKEIWENIAQELYHQLSDLLKIEDHLVNGYKKNKTDKISIPAKQYRLEVLLYYLHHGELPIQAVFQPEAVSIFLIDIAREQWQRLAEFILLNQVSQPFLFRLFQILSFEEIIRLTEEITENLSPAAKKELDLLLFALLNSDERYFDNHTSLMVASAFVQAAISNVNKPNKPNWEEAAARILTADKLQEVRKFLVRIPGNKPFFFTSTTGEKGTVDDEESRKGNGPVTNFRILSKDINTNFETPEGLEVPLTGNQNSLASPGIFYRDTSPGLEESTISESLTNKKTGDSYNVQNAGLLLLHPFLVRLFVNCGILTVNEKIISDPNLSKAGALLHFLATGRDEVYEFELGFIKVLLGLNPDQPLAVSKGLLSNSQKEEAESLLLSVIEHWSSLKNTSKEGLRSSFIQRNGLLIPCEDGWKVHLESAAYDVLLNTIPWSYSIVKLPWMPKPIYVECQTN